MQEMVHTLICVVTRPSPCEILNFISLFDEDYLKNEQSKILLCMVWTDETAYC